VRAVELGRACAIAVTAGFASPVKDFVALALNHLLFPKSRLVKKLRSSVATCPH
jgi:hypothetical protein